MHEAIMKAVQVCGSQSELARRIGVKQAHVWYWIHRGRKAPPEHCRAIETATGGVVSVYDLRPDVFEAPGSQGSRPIAEDR
ncbi:MAG: helix-turn-helix domain-containing protein [Spiribacter salinus]|uniref:Helix-turn-helix domain-containing protein n=1 Tax=Spiribacter salinus TaxID=1335746 RepID=A0A540VEP4_9GAMM|nr:MAG: helix-turn-helix domain-containing protein [Spiribacter salinus]